MKERAKLGEIALGDETCLENTPDRRCLVCNSEWRIKHRQLTPFEIAKAKWLKEVVKGRSWVEMMNDKDRADDEKAKSLMTPEYLAMWGKTSAEFDELAGDLEGKSNLDKKIKK